MSRIQLILTRTLELLTDKIVEKRTYEPGEVIFEEGDPSDGGFVVESGLVEGTSSLGDSENIALTFRRGDAFGHIAAIKGIPRLGTARAIERTTLIFLSNEELSDRLRRGKDDFLGAVVGKVRDPLLVGTQRVVIIDDDDLLVTLLSHNLTRRGYEVTNTDNGEDGLELIGSVSPDIVILGGMLSGMDGMEVLQRVRHQARTRDIPVILVSERKQEAEIVDAFRLGANDYLIKPFMPEELYARMRRILEV